MEKAARFIGFGIVFLVVGGIALLVVIAILINGGEPSGGPINKRDLMASERSIIGHAVRRGLKDPGSAHFKWGRATYGDQMRSSSMIYCGLINARNSFGGYGGDQRFAVSIYLRDDKVLEAALLAFGNDAAGRTCENAGYHEGYFHQIGKSEYGD